MTPNPNPEDAKAIVLELKSILEEALRILGEDSKKEN